MASALICSSSRSPRFLPLTVLDIRLALGKVELAGDAEAFLEDVSMYGCDEEDFDVENTSELVRFEGNKEAWEEYLES
jgi:hypothetical protein